MVLKAKAIDWRKNLALRRDEFRGPRSGVTGDQIHFLFSSFSQFVATFPLSTISSGGQSSVLDVQRSVDTEAWTPFRQSLRLPLPQTEIVHLDLNQEIV
ncbi:hypothetical protein TNCV_4631881 [Trichonephila clavipes]|nr:hypothetical protein TNCV_4631881 [Trichonephila clavipes]